MVSTSNSTPGGVRLYGTQSILALENFGSSGRQVGEIRALVRNYALVKLAAARANLALGVLDAPLAEAIIAACQEIADGEHDAQFPTPLLVGGGGTTTNMNFNEVIAIRASQLAGSAVHANDHVNASQSTNDTYPTAMALTILDLSVPAIAALRSLGDVLEAKGNEYDGIDHLGRTCLQDAVTLTVGQTHRSQAAAMRRVADDLANAVEQLTAVPLGATVLGTGVGAPVGYAEVCVRELSIVSGRQLRRAPDLFDALSHLDGYAAIASAGVRSALVMAKIAADLRFLASGPLGGISEVTLPSTQAGSSIMPGKVNPVIPEFVMQLSYRIRGYSYAVECAVAAGELELNVMEPVILDSLINLLEDLRVAASSFATRCVDGLIWNGHRRQKNLEGQFDKWVSLAAVKGYDAASQEVARAREASSATVGD